MIKSKRITITLLITLSIFLLKFDKRESVDLLEISGTGVNIHFTGDPIDIKLIKNAGFKYVRMDMNWASIEKQKNVFDFKSSGYDQLTNALISSGIKPYYILDYSNTLYEQNVSISTEEGFDGFSKFVETVTSRYKNKGIIWEIWNEPNLEGSWETQPNYDDYSTLVKKISKIIRRNDPSGFVVAPALAGASQNSLPWLQEVSKRGVLSYVDAISVHPYRGTDPETVMQDYEALRKLISIYSDREIPIISGEWGYSTGHGWNGLNLTENQQADYIVRMFLINFYQRIPLSIWYDWKNDGLDPSDGEHNFGLRENNVTIPKLAYQSVQVLNELMNGYHFYKRIDVGNENDYVLVFKNDDEHIIAACWTTDDEHEITLPKNIHGKKLSVYGEDIGVSNEKDVLTISSSPIYIIKNYTPKGGYK